MNILELIYPNTCGICEEISKNFLCNKCKIIIKNLIISRKIEYNNKYFSSLYYIFKYEGIIREKLLNYKFKNQSYLYNFFSEIIINNCNLKTNYDIILAVPIHKKRAIKRGYNQSDLIAKKISKKWKIEYNNKILLKCKNTVAQSTLSKTQRQKNVLGIYKIKETHKIENKSILLIDDIYTTGSTVNECAKVLIQNGARNVDVLVIAKD